MTACRCGALIMIALTNFVLCPLAQAHGGICAGQIDVLKNIGSSLEQDKRYCVPKEVTNLQATRVVIQWMDRSGESLQQPFLVVAMKALKQTWPCK